MYLRSYLNKSGVVHCDMWFQLCGGYFCVAFIFIYINTVGVYIEMQSWNEAIDDMKKRMFYEDCRFLSCCCFYFYYFLLVLMLRKLINGTDFFCVWYFIEFVEHLCLDRIITLISTSILYLFANLINIHLKYYYNVVKKIKKCLCHCTMKY